VDGTVTAYRVWGGRTGPGVVLVHGGGAHARWWDHIGPLLATGRRVIPIDISGHGDSGRRTSYSYGIWAREILAVAADAGIDAPPIVIGHSMGGVITLQLATLFGRSTEGAVIIDSPIRDLAPEEHAAERQNVFRNLRVYPDRETALARFRPVPDQPMLSYVADHVAATSIRPLAGGWTWKWDPAVLDGWEPLLPLTRMDCRVALFRAEYGIMSAAMRSARIAAVTGWSAVTTAFTESRLGRSICGCPSGPAPSRAATLAISVLQAHGWP
jgi:pimeloyl-ACP methyl ester carboxylesterase